MIKKRADIILLLICLIVGVIPVCYYLYNNYFFYPNDATIILNNRQKKMDGEIDISVDGTKHSFQLFTENNIPLGETKTSVSLEDLDEDGTLTMSIGSDTKYIVDKVGKDTRQLILIGAVKSINEKKNQVMIEFKGKKDNVKFNSTITFNLPE